MKIFLDNLPLGDIPGPRRQPGEFFHRLVGLRLSNAGNWQEAVIEPLYIPILRVHRRAGQLMIDVSYNRPLAYITLQLRPPFLSVFLFPWREFYHE